MQIDENYVMIFIYHKEKNIIFDIFELFIDYNGN
jgi:hypothetical protein